MFLLQTKEALQLTLHNNINYNNKAILAQIARLFGVPIDRINYKKHNEVSTFSIAR